MSTDRTRHRQVKKSGQTAFAAKVRLARAVLGWSQTDLGHRIGVTQRAIHKLERGETEPRRKTVDALNEIWRVEKIEFTDRRDGGLEVNIHPRAFRTADVKARSK